jgi:tellurite resistance protein TehA-like permease
VIHVYVNISYAQIDKLLMDIRYKENVIINFEFIDPCCLNCMLFSKYYIYYIFFFPVGQPCFIHFLHQEIGIGIRFEMHHVYEVVKNRIHFISTH